MSTSTASREVFVGVDVGTQGVRAAAIDPAGELVANARQPLPFAPDAPEQSPDEWWKAVVATLRTVAGQLTASEARLAPVALTVTSTSGTIVPLDEHFAPLHPALMYGDQRATKEAAEIEREAPALGANLSWAIPKIVWFSRTHPDQAHRVRAWRHATDVILGRLTGRWDVTDVTNALKTGYDPEQERWHPLLDHLGIDRSVLPWVTRSGEIIGTLTDQAAAETGLPRSVVVTTGLTDGCASQFAAGAVAPGAWNTTIGTTLVIKGVTRTRILDPKGRLYSHRHPDGYWMPGGASNTGADWITLDHAGQDLDELTAAAQGFIPTGLTAYPLRRAGERFPFTCPEARGFDPPGVSGPRLFAARLEGVAYLERLALDLVERLSGESVQAIYAAGGGSQSALWRQIRADVLRRPIYLPRYPEAAVGAAIVAAAGTRFGSLREAAEALIAIAQTTVPGENADQYEAGYHQFVTKLANLGYLEEGAPTS